ncbi:MerC domain-containing protein [Pseudomonas sp. CGJS7]|uniref:MerC domain-containing protein n=1 Tax=Pseudomonas sp. CGJS7 TaxID=3109348 RepID=UPI00300AC077
MRRSFRVPLLDLSAIGLSGLCFLHCLALPLLAAFLPSLTAWTQIEWLHIAFVAFAAPVTALALYSARRSGSLRRGIVALAAIGLACLIAGATHAIGDAAELPLTVIGSVLLASAHVGNWRSRHAAH